MSAAQADAVRLAAQHALPAMSAAIVELRAQGHHQFAGELTKLKEDWARRAMHYATAVALMPEHASSGADGTADESDEPTPGGEVIDLPITHSSRARAASRTHP